MECSDSNSRNCGQFSLLGKRRFAPFFFTQFLGAFNDNVFRVAILLYISFKAGNEIAGQADVFNNIAAGLFIIPMFLFSALAGQVADKFEKSMLIRRVKIVEIIIMLFGALAFYVHNIYLILAMLCLMGAQSTFFGPIKYSIIPQHLHRKEVVGGNALVEMGTYVAIILGAVLGGLLIKQPHGELWLGSGVFLLAVTGWLTSLFIPRAAAASPKLSIGFNFIKETAASISFARKKHSVFLAILAVSWFWAIGLAYLTQLPNFVKNYLMGNQAAVTLVLTVFSIGIGVGSLLCEKISGKRIDLGLVPVGILGMTGAGLYLVYGISGYTAPGSGFSFDCFYAQFGQVGAREFLWLSQSERILVSLVLIGIFGGFYIVPLFAFIQMRTREEYRSRVIAANNILNALFMVGISVLAVFLLGTGFLGLTIPQFFLVLSVGNLLVGIYICTVVPEYLLRFLAWILMHIFYRGHYRNIDYIPNEGPAVLVSNHITFVDSIILSGFSHRPIRFIMEVGYYNIPVLKYIMRAYKAIPIAPKKENEKLYDAAFKKISEELRNDELVCIFPEGKLTRDGTLNEFKRGIEKIMKKDRVPVIPVAMNGLWGSMFSRYRKKPGEKRPRRFWSAIEVVAGRPLEPGKASAENLYRIIKDMTHDGLKQRHLFGRNRK